MDLAKLTWPQAEEALRPRTIAILPIGATEPHGPHLPLDADVTIALAQSRRAADQLAKLGAQAVVLPPVAYGVTHFTDGFAGRISLKPATLWSLVEDVIESVEQHDVRQVVIVTGHLEPAHVEVLRGLVLDHAQRGPQMAQAILADVARRRFAQTLGEDFQKGDHAGRYETSLLLAADPGHVRERERAALPKVDLDLVGAIRGGAQGFLALGASQAYCGDPARATAAEGERLFARLADAVVACARDAWPDLFA
jgi:creatinine amidohydrolase